jgi:hypothetical protein
MRRASVSSRLVWCAIGCGVLLAGCGGSTAAGRPTAQQAAALRIPLATARMAEGPPGAPSPSLGATWALVPMGDLDQPDNRFWQVFVLSPTGTSWSLVTPKGVADNGGLVGSFGPIGGVLGFEVSAMLGFSPVAVSDDDGVHWSPGVLPTPLASVPDALATTPAGHLLALLGRTGSSIVASDDDAQASTSPLGSLSSLAARSGRSCTLTALTAVTFGPASQPIVGGLCQGSGRVGIFELTGSRWRLSGPVAPAAALNVGSGGASEPGGRSLDTEVLRLSSEGLDVSALAEVVASDGTASLFRLSENDSGAWKESPVFDVPPTQRMTATGNEPGGAAFVLLSHSGTVTAEVLPASGSGWTKLPDLPPGTATVAFGHDDIPYALAVNHSVLTVYRLSPTHAWAPVQVIIVPIQYASSP